METGCEQEAENFDSFTVVGQGNGGTSQRTCSVPPSPTSFENDVRFDQLAIKFPLKYIVNIHRDVSSSPSLTSCLFPAVCGACIFWRRQLAWRQTISRRSQHCLLHTPPRRHQDLPRCRFRWPSWLPRLRAYSRFVATCFFSRHCKMAT